jgi:hypothetical protein
MPTSQKTPAVIKVVVLLLVVAVVAAVVWAVALRRHGHRAAAALAPVAVTSTVPYNPRRGRNATTILTEAVDPLSLAVPSAWTAAPADELTLPAQMDAFAAKAPALRFLVQAQRRFALKAGVRLFAYRADAPAAFVSVVSDSTPAADDLTPASAAAMVASSRTVPNVVVSFEQLPVGVVLKFVSTIAGGSEHLVVEVLTLIVSGRSVTIEIVSEANDGGVPALFGQIEQSLSQG